MDSSVHQSFRDRVPKPVRHPAALESACEASGEMHVFGPEPSWPSIPRGDRDNVGQVPHSALDGPGLPCVRAQFATRPTSPSQSLYSHPSTVRGSQNGYSRNKIPSGGLSAHDFGSAETYRSSPSRESTVQSVRASFPEAHGRISVSCDEVTLRRLLREELKCAVQDLRADVSDASARLAGAIVLPEPANLAQPQRAHDGPAMPSLLCETECKRDEELQSGTKSPDRREPEEEDLAADKPFEPVLSLERKPSNYTSPCLQVLQQDPHAHLKRRYIPAAVNSLLDWLARLEEPPREGCFAEFVDGRYWETICTCVIVLNAIYTFFATNDAVMNSDRGSPNALFEALDVLFVAFYTLELALKLSVHGWYFFWGNNMHWDIFDFVLVCTGLHGVLSNFIDRGAGDGGGGFSLVFLRTMRLLKMARILRIFRLMRSLRELRLILNSLLSSIFALLWSIVTMLLIFFMFSLVFVQSASGYFREYGNAISEDDRRLLTEHFGSVQQAMLGLYMATTGGNDWGVYYEALQPVGGVTCTVYLFFVAFSQIALLNILTAVFVENATKLAEPDRQAAYAEEQKLYVARAKELSDIMHDIDDNHDGFISDVEFAKAMAGPEDVLRAYLGSVGVHDSDAVRFFTALQDSSCSDKVPIAAFTEGCLKLTGQAMALDIQGIASEVKLVHRLCRDFQKSRERAKHAPQ